MRFDNPIMQELLELITRLGDPNGLTEQDLQRITDITRYMNSLNPQFQVIEFVRED